MEKNNRKAGRIGIFGVAHSVYWPQFEGLKEQLLKYHGDLIDKIKANGVEVVDFGMIDDNRLAYESVPKIQAADVDVVFCNMLTYATSSVFAPIVMGVDRPMIMVALQPLRALDYTKANTRMQLENDNICSVPEFYGVAERLGKKIYDVISGCLYNDEKADKEIAEWCKIATALRGVRGARLGLMGHALNSMYDMHADPTAVSAAFNLHIPLLEPEELLGLFNEVTDEEIKAKSEIMKERFDMPDPKSDPITMKLTDEDLYMAAKAAAALDKFVEKNELTGLAYYCDSVEGSPIREVTSSLILGNSLLLEKGFPMCGEFDIKTCIAMLIMDRLGIGGSFAELHPFDFESDCILIGHDGPHHIAVAEGKPIVRSLTKYHGKPGHGASIEFKLKEGPITMLGIAHNNTGGFKFIIGEGESQKGPIPPTGNTNTRGVFKPDTHDFIKRWVMSGATHHYALGIGHHADTIKKIADILGIESVLIR